MNLLAIYFKNAFADGDTWKEIKIEDRYYERMKCKKKHFNERGIFSLRKKRREKRNFSKKKKNW